MKLPKAPFLAAGTLAMVASLMLVPPVGRSQVGDPAKELLEAQSYKADGFYEEAVPGLEAVSRKVPGSEFDLQSRLEQADYQFGGAHNKAATKAIFESIVRDFPNRTEGTIACLNLADIRYLGEKGTFAAYWAELDTLASSLGGPTVSAVAAGSEDLAIRPVPGLTPQVQQESLVEVYNLAASRVLGKRTGRTSEDGRQSLSLRLYLAEQFSGLLNENFLESFHHSLQARSGGADIDWTLDRVPPKIYSLKARSTSQGGLAVTVSVSDNIVLFANHVEIWLDQQQRQEVPLFRFRPKHMRADRFKMEDLRIVMKYDIPALSPGRHQLVCKVTDANQNSSSKTRYFKVKGADCEMEDQDQEDGNGDDF